MTIGKVDPVTGSVGEDFRSEILGFLGSSTNYTSLYREALLNRNYERTEQEISEAIQVAKDASEALRQLTQDISTFNLEYYRELEGRFALEGGNGSEDFDYLFNNNFRQADKSESSSNIQDRLEMFNQNQKAIIKSKYDGIVNIRHKCIGIQSMN